MLHVRRLALVLSVVAQAFALDPTKTLTQYAHREWGQEEGLFQPTIYSILQTRDGFLWLGTQDSLIRFDGLRFREFDEEAKTGFHHNLVRALLEDREGNLWAASIGGGVAKIAPGGSVTQYTTRNGLPSDDAFCLDGRTQSDVWICTKEGLARLHDGAFRVFTKADGLPGNGVHLTCEATDGTRWVAGLDFGLMRMRRDRFEPYNSGDFSVPQNVTALDCARDGTVWVGADYGVFEIRGQTVRSLSTHDGLPDNAVSSLADSPDGSVWIGTNDGITRFRKGEISVYRTRDGLSHSLVLSLYTDREGSLWAGTKDGLDQFTDGKLTPYTTNEGLLSNDAGPVLEDASGKLWIGTLGHGLNCFDGHHFRAVTRKDGLLSDTVLSLAMDGAGDVWVGTSNGLNRLQNGRVTGSYARRDGLSDTHIRALLVDAQGTLWVGTDAGLDRLNAGKFLRAQVSEKPVIALAKGRTTLVFASTAEPALHYMREGAFQAHTLDVTHPIDSFYFDSARRTAWMGTLGSGLLRWKNGAIAHVRVKDGLYDNRIYSILADGRSNLWMASSKGIFRVSERDLDDFVEGRVRRIASIPFSTGQLRFECQSGVQPAAVRTRDGRLWFSTTNGLVVVDPNRLQRNAIAPPAAITAVVVNGERKDAHTALGLKSSENNVEIRYSALTFISPEKVTFRYRLQGYDSRWTKAGVRREAFFTNLPPGNFRFEVMARNADGVESVRPASLAFGIEPRFYQRRWFVPLVVVLLALMIAAGYRLRVRQLRRRFDLVLAERSRIARELHDTLLQGLAGVTMQLQALWTRMSPSKERQLLSEIISDAGACSAEARQSVWGLRDTRGGFGGFSAKLREMAERMVEDRPVTLFLDVKDVPLDECPEAQHQLLRIAQEAISNALAHAGAVNLRVRLRHDAQSVHLSIADDGIGFSDRERRGNFGHFGLTGIEERANAIGARAHVVSSPGEGTTISIDLPLSRAVHRARNVEAVHEHQTK